jgi:hypothetical protein
MKIAGKKWGEGYVYKGADKLLGDPMCWNPTTGEKHEFSRHEATHEYAPNWIVPLGGKRTKKNKKKQKKSKKLKNKNK